MLLLLYYSLLHYVTSFKQLLHLLQSISIIIFSNYVTSRWDNLYITEKAIYNYDINILISTYRNNMDRTWVVLLFTIIFLLTELIGHVGLLINESKISLLKERIKERRRNI